MWSLKRLAVDNYRRHIDIAFPVDADPAEITEAEKLVLLDFYARYEQVGGRPDPALLGDETRLGFRQSVHDAYSLVQDGRRLGELRDAIKLLAELCPYCGFGPIEALDHLLPRSQYKLFSIFPLNLVPCCSACNVGKRRKATGEATKHQVHTYIDDLDQFDFLRAKVSIDAATGGLKIEYQIERPHDMSEELHQRLVNHLEEFDLAEKYRKQVNIFLGELGYSIGSTFDEGGPAKLRAWIAGTASALAIRFGRNDWRTALMKGLLTCAQFCEGGFRTTLGERRAQEVP